MISNDWVDLSEECRVCLGSHDEEIHEATVTVHQWLRSEIARRTDSAAFVLEPVPSTDYATVWALSCGA